MSNDRSINPLLDNPHQSPIPPEMVCFLTIPDPASRPYGIRQGSASWRGKDAGGSIR